MLVNFPIWFWPNFLFVLCREARARSTVFEAVDAIPEQVTADAERRRKEERRCLVNQQANKVHFRTIFSPLLCDPWFRVI